MQMPWAICMRTEEQEMKTAELEQSQSQLLVERTHQLCQKDFGWKRI